MTTASTHTILWPEVLSWILAHLDEEIEVTIEGPSGLLLDGTARLEGFTDCLPGDVPTVCWLDFAPDMRLWLNVRNIESTELEEVSDALTVTFGADERYHLVPLP